MLHDIPSAYVGLDIHKESLTVVIASPGFRKTTAMENDAK